MTRENLLKANTHELRESLHELIETLPNDENVLRYFCLFIRGKMSKAETKNEEPKTGDIIGSEA